MNNFKQIKKILLSVIDFVRLKLPEQDIANVHSFIEHDEFGIAYDVLCTQIYEYDIPINDDIYAKIIEAGKRMELNTEEWECLKELIQPMGK